jgi:hypothetical protein
MSDVVDWGCWDWVVAGGVGAKVAVCCKLGVAGSSFAAGTFNLSLGTAVLDAPAELLASVYPYSTRQSAHKWWNVACQGHGQ